MKTNKTRENWASLVWMPLDPFLPLTHEAKATILCVAGSRLKRNNGTYLTHLRALYYRHTDNNKQLFFLRLAYLNVSSPFFPSSLGFTGVALLCSLCLKECEDHLSFDAGRWNVKQSLWSKETRPQGSSTWSRLRFTYRFHCKSQASSWFELNRFNMPLLEVFTDTVEECAWKKGCTIIT